jgi:hypothetical protein
MRNSLSAPPSTVQQILAFSIIFSIRLRQAKMDAFPCGDGGSAWDHLWQTKKN